MKSVLSFVFLFVVLSSYAQIVEETETQIRLRGTYQGKNLHLQNPYNDGGLGFCIRSVFVNGETICESNGAGFEVDFACHMIAIGDSIIVEINHPKSCRPKILNKEVLGPRSIYYLHEISIDTSEVLRWTASVEIGRLPYRIEQYRWNKWITIGEVWGDGTIDTTDYTFDVSEFIHADTNQFRISQKDYRKKERKSDAVILVSEQAEVYMLESRILEVLKFSGETHYEIYDAYGNIVKKGFGTEVDCLNFKRGNYYINLDNRTETFTKM